VKRAGTGDRIKSADFWKQLDTLGRTMPNSKLSSDEVADRILTTMRHMLDRPIMYSSTAQSMEETLCALDRVRELLIHGDSTELPPYALFLISRGFGSSSFNWRYSQQHPEADSSQQFQALVDFWREYLRTRQ
jgi:hypothetical protein